jgi:hypothetical protein
VARTCSSPGKGKVRRGSPSRTVRPQAWCCTSAVLVGLRRKKKGGDASPSRQESAPLVRRVIDAKNPRPRDRFPSAPSREVFHSRRRRGRRRAGPCVRHGSPVPLPAFSCSAGFSLRALYRASQDHARSHRSSHRFEHWPTALPRSDAHSVQALRRCRIDFVRSVANAGSEGRWAGDRARHSWHRASDEPGSQGPMHGAPSSPGFRPALRATGMTKVGVWPEADDAHRRSSEFFGHS